MPPLEDELAAEFVGFRLVEQQRHIKKLHDAPAVADGLEQGFIGPVRRVWRAVGNCAVFDQGHAVDAGVEGRTTGLQVEQILVLWLRSA